MQKIKIDSKIGKLYFKSDIRYNFNAYINDKEIHLNTFKKIDDYKKFLDLIYNDLKNQVILLFKDENNLLILYQDIKDNDFY